jgi:hypothetical protein
MCCAASHPEGGDGDSVDDGWRAGPTYRRGNAVNSEKSVRCRVA